MTISQIQILDKYSRGEVSLSKCIRIFGTQITNIAFVKNEIKYALESKDEELIERSIFLMWFSTDLKDFIDELNTLLVNPYHISHQVIAKHLQDLKGPKSIPFVEIALNSKFDYLSYTCSNSDAIAKWFSWILFSIGTNEAVDLMKDFVNSKDEGIKNEMIYRLKKVK